jgi:tetratricopeptide (TPR) repeat protein
MHQEAARTAQIALKKNPLHCDMLALQAQAQYLLGEPEDALRNAYTALALKQDSSDSLGNTPLESGSHSAEATSEIAPEKVNDDIRRLIINSLEAVGAWQTALDERETLMGALEKPTLEDLHSLMYCAMQAEQPELAVQASKKAFEIDPEDLLTHQRLAEASLMLGDYHVAIQHFKQGTHLAPDKPQLWLGLVKALRLAGEDDKSLTTLRAASQAVPEEAEVHLTLGEVYLEQGELTQALSCLRRAASLASDETNAASERIALRLGQALYQLGHLEEARQVLSKAYRLACGVDDETESSPERQISCPNLELAYAFARTLLGLKELNLAIPMLTEAVRVQPDESGPSLDLSRALLLVNDQPAGAQRAIPFLQRILGINPDGAEGGYSAALDASPGLRAEARSLLAEAYAAVGDWGRIPRQIFPPISSVSLGFN